MSCWPSMDSNRGDEDIDEALINDSVKKLLSDSEGNHYDLAADILSSNTSSAVNVSQLVSHSSGATVQEGMDLVDALDTLVQHLSRESNNKDIDSNIDTNCHSMSAFDVVILDHNYCQPVFVRDVTSCNTTPVNAQTIEQKTPSFDTSIDKQIVNLAQISSLPSTKTYSSSSTTSSPQSSGNNNESISGKSPKTLAASRRSQRQIDKIEKSVLEKIKAENQEMLKREKESMESPIIKITPKPESVEDNKDTDESELVIDLDKKEKMNINRQLSQKRPKKSKLQTDESNKKSRMENKQEIHDKRLKEEMITKESPEKHENSELEDVIAALSGVTDSDNERTPLSGRTQRTRRKPKRWDDDEVEVDFSGQLGGLTDEQQKQQLNEDFSDKVDVNEDKPNVDFNENIKVDDNIENKIKAIDPQLSSDEAFNDEDEEDSGSDFGSEDDPDKLWCVCRQPHNDRFMIGCDSCEEWFHGKCVNVTKLQGRQMEKAKQEWLCTTCTKGISDGMTREELKKIADQKRNKLEAEERMRAKIKRDAKEKFLKKEKINREVKTENKKKEFEEKKKDQKHDKIKNVPKKLQMPPKKREFDIKSEEESEKLKKLIRSSKKDLNKKREMINKKLSKESLSNKSTKSPVSQRFESISKVVSIVRKPEVKKKHKDAIDPSVQDLFKAEPIRKSLSTTPTTPTTPSTPGGIPFQRKSSDTRRTSTSALIERLCPCGCGKMVKSDSSIYWNSECIEVHVNETIKLLRIVRKEKEEKGAKKDVERRVVVVEKSSGRLLSGREAIPEKDVLEYIKTNPTFEVFRPSLGKDKKKEDIKSSPLSPTKISTPKKDDKRSPILRTNSRVERIGEGSDPIRTNVKSSLKETLILRCKEVNETTVQSNEITKIAHKIEEELFKLFNKDTSGKYRNKYRSLMFNLKDSKNQGLFRKVVNGKISPERLVHMSAEELASSELAKWREREKISMLEMIKRDAAEKVNQVIVKKTHKGEELIESVIVSETTNELKSGENKCLTPVSAPNSGVSTILDDLMGSSTTDTTSQHRTHLFSNNCRICTNKQLSDDKSEVVKKPLSHSSSTQREEHTRPTPKRVRVELESANKILLEAAKLSSNVKMPFNADDEDSAEAPSSTLCLSSPEAPSSSSSSRPVWKGSVFMQDVAKFAANAVKVSGTVTDFLSQDVSEQITVCGRIAPEQVLDYVKKLKFSSRTEIGIIKLISSREERVGYDAFFNYLDSRGRYGVVGSTGKLLKDFYILPLPKNGDVPEVLLPFDGPGLDKKSMRPNLLLGILIRSKKPMSSQAPQTSSSASSQSKSKTSNPLPNPNDRSYTPPPKNPSSQSSPDDNKEMNDVSYTPPRISSKTNNMKSIVKKSTADDDEPYDPEEADLSNSNSMPSSTSSIQELMDQIAKSSNPVEMTSSVLSAIASSSNFELQRRLLEQLTAKVEEQKRQLEEQKLEAEAHFASNNSSNSSSVIPGLDGQFGSLKDIKIPDNLQDILSSVRQKTHEIEEQQERLKAVAESGFKFNDPIVKNFGSKNVTEDIIDESIERSPEAEPMDLDEDVTPAKSTIIEVNTPLNNPSVESKSALKTTDPRLRSKKQTPLPSLSEETGGDSRVAAMTSDELMQKAKEQMAALAQMEKTKDNKPSAAKIKIEWKKKK